MDKKAEKKTPLLFKYFFYCGTDKETYRGIKKMAYVSNFNIWKFLHVFITLIFFGMTITSLVGPDIVNMNREIYIIAFVYYLVISCLFFTAFKPESIVPQFFIYLSMIVLMCFGLYLSIRKPGMMAVSFLVIMIVMPMIMIDKPYFMAILLSCASVVFIIHSYMVKSGDVLNGDIVNCIVVCVIGIVMNTVYNTLRVREFLLQKKIEEDRDTDLLTGLSNKNSLMHQINTILESKSEPGIMLVIDIDHFKAINDTYGHSFGDLVLNGLGTCLSSLIPDSDVKGRFGGDEFIVFLRNTDNVHAAEMCAEKIIEYVNTNIHSPNRNETIGLCIGIAMTDEKDYDYDSVLRKADAALYHAKNNGRNRYSVYSN